MPENENPQGGDNKAEALQKALDKHKGDAMALAAFLFSDNFDLRDKNRKLRERMPEGSVVISKEEAMQFEAFKALNLKPEEVKAKIEKFDEVAEENAKLKKQGTLHQVSEAGWKLSVLTDFDTLEGGLEYVVRDETKDGKTQKVAYVVVDGKERDLEAYATEKRPDLIPALKAGATSGGGTAYPEQPGAGGRAASKSVFDKQREDVKKKQETTKADVHPMFKREQAVAS